jgi:hypothetical protein
MAVESGGHRALDFRVGLQRLVGDGRHMTPSHRHHFRLHQVVEFFVESDQSAIAAEVVAALALAAAVLLVRRRRLWSREA